MSLDYSNLLHPVQVDELVTTWLKEDTPSFDYGGFVVGAAREEAVVISKGEGTLAGVPFVDAVFRQLQCTVTWNTPEGTTVSPRDVIATVSGPVCKLLVGERVALNTLSRCSGVATLARRLHKLKEEQEWQGTFAGTRKTTPGFRLVEKYGLQVGGIDTHRYDLSSMVMLKDNHIWSVGSITKAVQSARQVCGFSMKVEVECRSLDEAQQAAQAGADVVMFDNFTPQALHEAAKQFKDIYPHVTTEASGGITEDTVTSYMTDHVDVISMGQCTQGYMVIPYSMKVKKEGHDPNNPLVRKA